MDVSVNSLKLIKSDEPNWMNVSKVKKFGNVGYTLFVRWWLVDCIEIHMILN